MAARRVSRFPAAVRAAHLSARRRPDGRADRSGGLPSRFIHHPGNPLCGTEAIGGSDAIPASGLERGAFSRLGVFGTRSATRRDERVSIDRAGGSARSLVAHDGCDA
ncbi:hypothetical protein KM472_gp135 [Cynomolgus macaque cytomegalovirus strain Ottawa]|uniref:Uncharacterized protein n=1 Tax=macacine betaherpesvirus 8 TaxID=2560567 RepID=G8H1D8_9BETA|nr:hypothetical protein KM472_gp135 [Cynomolgus macaque cytomegalovirus strain Ottawa]AEQ32212.1 hypothetical protein cy132 [Cynomolgus macaque cytomegalovirus strain Ottawa]